MLVIDTTNSGSEVPKATVAPITAVLRPVRLAMATAAPTMTSAPLISA